MKDCMKLFCDWIHFNIGILLYPGTQIMLIKYRRFNLNFIADRRIGFGSENIKSSAERQWITLESMNGVAPWLKVTDPSNFKWFGSLTVVAHVWVTFLPQNNQSEWIYFKFHSFWDLKENVPEFSISGNQTNLRISKTVVRALMIQQIQKTQGIHSVARIQRIQKIQRIQLIWRIRIYCDDQMTGWPASCTTRPTETLT